MDVKLTPAEVEALTEQCYDLLAKARLEVLKKGPYFSHVLYALTPTMTPGFDTIAVTDTLLLILDPVRVLQDSELSTPKKLAGVLAHECMHVLRGMHRVGALAEIDSELANTAADLPINSDLREAGWELPSWGVFPEKYNFPEGLTMEEYFALLLKDAEQSKSTTRYIVKEAKGGAGDPDVCAGSCGSAAGNAPAQEAASAASAGAGRHPGEISNAQRSSLEAAQKHFDKKGQGDTPGWITDELNKLEDRKRDRDWVRELSSVVRRRSGIIQAGGADFSLSRPSRRSLLRGGILRPGMIEQQYEAAIYIDTSGSMGDEELHYAKNVICNIMEQTGIDRVWLGQCDAMVHEVKRVKVRDVPTLPMRGRGGTDFRPIFESVLGLKPRPDMVVVVTDGDGPAPEVCPPGLCVIWVIVPTGYRRPATWGHLVVASNDHALAEPYYM